MDNWLFFSNLLDFPDSSVSKESMCNAGDQGSIPGLRRSSGEGKGYSLQYSGLENSMDCIVHGVAESEMTEQLSLHSSLLSVYSELSSESGSTWEEQGTLSLAWVTPFRSWGEILTTSGDIFGCPNWWWWWGAWCYCHLVGREQKSC